MIVNNAVANMLAYEHTLTPALLNALFFMVSTRYDYKSTFCSIELSALLTLVKLCPKLGATAGLGLFPTPSPVAFYAQRADAFVQVGALHSERSGCARDVPLRILKRA